MKEHYDLPHHHNDEALEKRIMESVPSDDSFDITSGILKQIGDPTRLKIFWLLCHTEECVINISTIVKMSSPAVAHHLKILKDVGLVISRREGKEVYYKASDKSIVDELHRSIESIMKITCPF